MWTEALKRWGAVQREKERMKRGEKKARRQAARAVAVAAADPSTLSGVERGMYNGAEVVLRERCLKLAGRRSVSDDEAAILRWREWPAKEVIKWWQKQKLSKVSKSGGRRKVQRGGGTSSSGSGGVSKSVATEQGAAGVGDAGELRLVVSRPRDREEVQRRGQLCRRSGIG